MEIRIESRDLDRYLRKLRRVDPRRIQRLVVAPAMRKAAPIWRRAQKAALRPGHGISDLDRQPKLKDVLLVRVFARARKSPHVLMTVGTRKTPRDRRPAGATGRRISNQPPAGVRLRFLRGTSARYTHGGLTRAHSRRYKAKGRLFRQAGAFRGRMPNLMIDEAVEAAASAPSRQMVRRVFFDRAAALFAIKGNLA